LDLEFDTPESALVCFTFHLDFELVSVLVAHGLVFSAEGAGLFGVILLQDRHHVSQNQVRVFLREKFGLLIVYLRVLVQRALQLSEIVLNLHRAVVGISVTGLYWHEGIVSQNVALLALGLKQ